MNRRQRRIQTRRARRVGVVLASMAMLATTAGLGGAAFAGGTPGEVGGINHSGDYGAFNGAGTDRELGSARYHSSQGRASYQESLTENPRGAFVSTAGLHINYASGGCFFTTNGNYESFDTGRTNEPDGYCTFVIGG